MHGSLAKVTRHSEVLVASHDKAFLEALQVTDKIHVSRGGVGEPGHLRVTLAADEQTSPSPSPPCPESWWRKKF